MHDYGLDLQIYTYNRDGEIDEGNIAIQVKATDRLRIQPGKGHFPFRVSRADLVRWLAEPMPLILIVYDATKDVAYWLYVQSHFANQENFNLFATGKELTVHLPTGQKLTPGAVQRFARFRDRVLVQTKVVSHDQDKD